MTVTTSIERKTVASTPPKGIFDAYLYRAWPIQFDLEIVVGELHGGTPRNPDMLRQWLLAKAGFSTEEEVQAEMERIFGQDPLRVETDLAGMAAEATDSLAERSVNGFKRDPSTRELYMEGRQLKACIKEGVSVARAADKLDKKFGTTGKGIISFAAEHIMVLEDHLPLGVTEHDDLHRRFVKTRYGTGITVEEVLFDATIHATVATDWPFSEEEWAMIWLTSQMQGFGASRSQGFGRFTVTRWEQKVAPSKNGNGRRRPVQSIPLT